MEQPTTEVMDTTDTDKIVLIERLIRTKKITLVEGLLLLKEKVITREAPVVPSAPATDPNPWFTPSNGVFGPARNPYLMGGTGSGGASTLTTTSNSDGINASFTVSDEYGLWEPRRNARRRSSITEEMFPRREENVSPTEGENIMQS